MSEIFGWVTGSIALVLGGLQIRDWVVHRERLSMRLLSLHQYCWSWDEDDVQRCDKGPYPGAIKIGDPRRAFVVLEFLIHNSYRSNVSVGRFLLQDWMYADGYRDFMYSRHRDYRVFDLFTRERISLDSFRLVEPGQEFGVRLEIFEQGYDPARNFPQHRPAVVHLPDTYTLQFHADRGKKQQRIFQVEEYQRIWFDDRFILRRSSDSKDQRNYYESSDSRIYRWSDDLIPPSEPSAVSPSAVPQAMSETGWEWPKAPSWAGMDHSLGGPGRGPRWLAGFAGLWPRKTPSGASSDTTGEDK